MEQIVPLDDMEKATQTFFRMHWNEQEIETSPPEWRSVRPPCTRQELPYYELGGCYALQQKTGIVYIGTGTSRSSGIYEGFGITRRLHQHVIKADLPWGSGNVALREKYSDIVEIHTIGFTQDVVHLACALEEYLIVALKPERNTMHA